MNYNRWVSSRNKWETIVSILTHGDPDEIKYINGDLYLDGTRAEVVNSCGYCYEYIDLQNSQIGCRKCPLHKIEFCSGRKYHIRPGSTHQYYLFWEIHTDLSDKQYKQALEKSKKMLAQIKKGEPKRLLKRIFKR